MYRVLARGLVPVLVLVAACSSASNDDGASTTTHTGGRGGAGTGGRHDAGSGGRDTGSRDAGEGEASTSSDCSVGGRPGQCISVSECAEIPDHGSTPGYCPGPADIQCCTEGPNVSDNPPVPAGWKLMTNADVTPEMTSWAVAILHDTAGYPMFSSATMTFGGLLVMARVEWHPPDFQNDAVHRGVTLYEQA